MESYEIVQVFALVFWSFQLLPQAIQNHQRKSTEGLSSLLMLSWSIGSLFTGIYSVGAKFPILFIIQPNLFLVFSIICWTQCHYYDSKTPFRGVMYGLLLAATIVLVESLSGLALLHRNLDTNDWSFVLIGSLSTVFFGVGYIPQFYEIYTTRVVKGISLLFLAIDITGSVLSILSLILQGYFEPISGACYAIVFLCDALIVLLYFTLPRCFEKLLDDNNNNNDSTWGEEAVIH